MAISKASRSLSRAAASEMVDADCALLGLLGVQRIMLDRGHHMLVLDGADGLARQRARQQRVLAQIFEIAAVARLARQVHAAGQQHVQPAGARILGDGGAAGIGDLHIPGGGQRQAGGQGGGVLRARLPLIQATPRLASDSASCRNAQPRDAGRIAGGEGRADLRQLVDGGWGGRRSRAAADCAPPASSAGPGPRPACPDRHGLQLVPRQPCQQTGSPATDYALHVNHQLRPVGNIARPVSAFRRIVRKA